MMLHGPDEMSKRVLCQAAILPASWARHHQSNKATISGAGKESRCALIAKVTG
jgi:hypothetical protein